MQPIVIEGEIENVMEFSYLGSLIAENDRIDSEVDKRIANASKAFRALRQAVFKDAHLSTNTMRKVYQACDLSVLIYGGECWTPLRKHLKMNTFHHRCICTVLRITNRRQWEECISSQKVRQKLNEMFSKGPENITEKDISDFESQSGEWVQKFIQVYQTKANMPYIQAISNHVGEFMRIHGSILPFTQQGLEKFNDVVTKHYIRAASVATRAETQQA